MNSVTRLLFKKITLTEGRLISSRWLFRSLLAVFVLQTLFLTSVQAESNTPLVDGKVKVVHEDQYGRIFIGGEFTSVNGIPARNIAVWENGIWNNLGTGADDVVNAIEVADDGRVFIGGNFKAVGTISVNHIAVWNGISWEHVGIGTNRRVLSLKSLSSGALFVFGDFTLAGGEIANSIAVWQGNRWLPDTQAQKMLVERKLISSLKF